MPKTRISSAAGSPSWTQRGITSATISFQPNFVSVVVEKEDLVAGNKGTVLVMAINTAHFQPRSPSTVDIIIGSYGDFHASTCDDVGCSPIVVSERFRGI